MRRRKARTTAELLILSAPNYQSYSDQESKIIGWIDSSKIWETKLFNPNNVHKRKYVTLLHLVF